MKVTIKLFRTYHKVVEQEVEIDANGVVEASVKAIETYNDHIDEDDLFEKAELMCGEAEDTDRYDIRSDDEEMWVYGGHL